jgi:hypothetical protein
MDGRLDGWNGSADLSPLFPYLALGMGEGAAGDAGAHDDDIPDLEGEERERGRGDRNEWWSGGSALVSSLSLPGARAG